MCWHKWTKWERHEKKFLYVPFDNPDKKIEHIKIIQERKCKKCGYQQRKEVDEY
jgi:hypothetical protein